MKKTDVLRQVSFLEKKGMRDNDDYISIPMDDWLNFKDWLSKGGKSNE